MFEKEAESKGKEFDWKFNLGVDLSDAGARLWKGTLHCLERISYFLQIKPIILPKKSVKIAS